MQPFTYETAEERSRAGRAHLYTTIAQTQPKLRKRSKSPLTERGQDLTLIWCVVIAVGTYLAGHIWQGIGPVLRAHGG